MNPSAFHYGLGVASVAGLLLAGCQDPGSKLIPVAQVWQSEAATDAPASTTDPAAGRHGPQASDEPAIAVVDGQPVARRRVIELLLRGHGVGILEQFIVHDAALRVADQKGLTITPADIRLERDRTLARLVDVKNPSDLSSDQRAAAENLLREVLARQNISDREFELGLERNAALRKIVGHDMHFGDGDLQAEFERNYGERVEIRHIQVRTPREANDVLERLNADADFAELARAYSADSASSGKGGRLPVFSRNDQNVPQTLREAAFKLEPGTTSKPIRVRHDLGTGTALADDEWLHIIRVERRLPASEIDWQSIRPELEQRLAARLVEPAMEELHRTLFMQAKIEIRDPVLREEFERKHGRREAQGHR
ncbi:MAG TPA: peptidylprolyl isomerase [Phycisphaerae bacterium]